MQHSLNTHHCSDGYDWLLLSKHVSLFKSDTCCVEGQTVRQSVGRCDEREGKGRRGLSRSLSHTISRTYQIDAQKDREKQSWRDVAQQLTIATAR